MTTKPKKRTKADTGQLRNSASRPAKRTRDAALDEALEETFPASDPIAVGTPTGTEPPRAPIDRKAPILARG